jgi:hypothetical protein
VSAPGSSNGCGRSVRPSPRWRSGRATARRPSSCAGKRAFVTVVTDHHGDGRFAIWCAAPAGTQALLAAADPDRFFVPPYYGRRGWLGVRVDRGLDWHELAGIVEDAYAEVAPARLVAAAAGRA